MDGNEGRLPIRPMWTIDGRTGASHRGVVVVTRGPVEGDGQIRQPDSSANMRRFDHREDSPFLKPFKGA